MRNNKRVIKNKSELFSRFGIFADILGLTNDEIALKLNRVLKTDYFDSTKVQEWRKRGRGIPEKYIDSFCLALDIDLKTFTEDILVNMYVESIKEVLIHSISIEDMLNSGIFDEERFLNINIDEIDITKLKRIYSNNLKIALNMTSAESREIKTENFSIDERVYISVTIK